MFYNVPAISSECPNTVSQHSRHWGPCGQSHEGYGRRTVVHMTYVYVGGEGIETFKIYLLFSDLSFELDEAREKLNQAQSSRDNAILSIATNIYAKHNTAISNNDTSIHIYKLCSIMLHILYVK